MIDGEGRTMTEGGWLPRIGTISNGNYQQYQTLTPIAQSQSHIWSHCTFFTVNKPREIRK
jgi:hypothetical protein